VTGRVSPRGHLTADLVLLGVTAGWGATFPAIKVAVAGTDPMVFMAIRFGLTALILAALLRRRLFAGLAAIRGRGLLLSALFFSSYAFQAFGLTTTSATRSAFLTGLSVVIVPMLYVIVRRRMPGALPLAGVVLSLAGLLLMTRPDLGRFETGDFLTLMCALVYAFYVIGLETFTGDGRADAYIGIQALFSAAAACVLAVPRAVHGIRWSDGLTVGLLVTVPVTVITLIGLTRFQSRTTATRAALIYAAEPVFAFAVAWLWLGERLDGSGVAGVALILAGVLAAVFG